MATAMPSQPVVDGDVIPRHPIDRIAAGAAADVDIIVGSDTEDWQLFAVAGGAMDQVTNEILTGAVADHGYRAVAAYGLPADETIAAYRAAYPSAKPGELLAAIETDWWGRIPALRLADAQVGGRSATYMYVFAWPSPAFGGVFGACRALEIGFVFNTLDKGPNQLLGPLLGIDPPRQLATAPARSLGRIRNRRGSRLAEVPVRTKDNDALRYGLDGRIRKMARPNAHMGFSRDGQNVPLRWRQSQRSTIEKRSPRTGRTCSTGRSPGPILSL